MQRQQVNKLKDVMKTELNMYRDHNKLSKYNYDSIC